MSFKVEKPTENLFTWCDRFIFCRVCGEKHDRYTGYVVELKLSTKPFGEVVFVCSPACADLFILSRMD